MDDSATNGALKRHTAIELLCSIDPLKDAFLDNRPTLPPHANRVVISVNPKAGARSAQDRVDRLVELLARQDIEAEVLTSLDEVGDRANSYFAEGALRALVAVGGDGTAAELANRAAPGLPLTLLPAGNENLLARYLGLEKAPESLSQTIAKGTILRLDAARANGRIVLLMISCGFDAEVVRLVHDRRTGHIRSRNYIKPILQSIRRYEYPEIRVQWDEDPGVGGGGAGCVDGGGVGGWSAPSAVRWLFAFNLPCYGGGLKLAPKADGSDGLLDLCTFDRGSLWHGLRYAAGVLLRRHQRMADCHTRRVRRLRLTSDAEVPYQLDGDPGGTLPVEVEVLPDYLSLVVPSDTAARLRGPSVPGEPDEATELESPEDGPP